MTGGYLTGWERANRSVMSVARPSPTRAQPLTDSRLEQRPRQWQSLGATLSILHALVIVECNEASLVDRERSRRRLREAEVVDQSGSEAEIIRQIESARGERARERELPP